MPGAQYRGTPLSLSIHFLSQAIRLIDAGGPTMQVNAEASLAATEAELVKAAAQYSGNRTIRACGRIVRRMKKLKYCRSSAMILDDVNVILIELTATLEG